MSALNLTAEAQRRGAGETAAPLLLMEGAEPLFQQIAHARFMGPQSDYLCAFNDDVVMCCGVETSGIREWIPGYLRQFPRLGCVVVENPPLQTIMNGDGCDWQSVLLFAPIPWAFRGAHKIARQLAKSNPGRAALLESDDFYDGAVYLIRSIKHRIAIDGVLRDDGRAE